MKEDKTADHRFKEQLAISDSLWKPYHNKRDELLNRHAWIKDLLSGGGGTLMGYTPKDPMAKVESLMNPAGTALDNTAYYHPIKDEGFIHFTSFQSFKEIINSGIIRLYNPHFGNDPNEIVFGSKSRYETKVDSDSTLERLFVLSLNNEIAKDDLTMWKLYGNDGNGVGLVFEFLQETDLWSNWYFGKVLYGENEVITKLDDFHEDYKTVQAEMGQPPLLDLDIVPIYAFHKSGFFQTENEVRLLHYNKTNARSYSYGREQQSEGMKIKKTLNRELRETYYLEYPLWWKHNGEKADRHEAPQYHPKIALKEIILGYRHNPSDVVAIKSWCSDIIHLNSSWKNTRFGAASPQVSISSLHDYFS